MTPIPRDLFLLASAVAGRRTAVHVAREEDGGLHAYSDGQSIVLPPTLAFDEDLWMHIATQALLIGAGSLEPAVLRRLVARPGAARRYAWLEALRAGELLRERVPARLLGALAASGMSPAPTSCAADSATQALSGLPLGEPPHFIGTVRPLSVLRGSIARAEASSWLKSAAARGSRPQDTAHSPVREFGADEASEDSRILHLLSNPFGGRNPVSDLLNQLLGVGASRDHRQAAAGPDGAEMPIGRIERAWRRGAQAIRARLPVELPEPDIRHEATACLYPEWDGAAGRYRKDWVCVDEVDPWRPGGPRDVAAATSAPNTHLRRELSHLPLDFEMHGHQREGSDFDVGRLIDYAAELRTGCTASSPEVYRASRRTRRDLGVVVVMDASGSTEERNERGESVFEHHATAAFKIARSFCALGDRVAFYGFQSWGRRLVHMIRLKGHEEAWSGRVAQRLAQLDAAGFTRTGAAVRHADRLLRDRIRLPHRLLVLIFDGLSYDSDYEGRHAEEDTRKALAQAHARGTACVCVCIGGSGEAARLANVFGATRLLMVDDAAQVDARLRVLCARALADVSRRCLSPRRKPAVVSA